MRCPLCARRLAPPPDETREFKCKGCGITLTGKSLSQNKEIAAHFHRMMAEDPEVRLRIHRLSTAGVNAMFSRDAEARDRAIDAQVEILKSYIERHA